MCPAGLSLEGLVGACSALSDPKTLLVASGWHSLECNC